MKNHGEELLNNALAALKTDEPSSVEISNAAKRVAIRLGVDHSDALVSEPAMDAIDGCDDVQKLIDAYRARTLSTARSVLVEAHLRDCRACLRVYRSGSGNGAVNWSAPQADRSFVWPARTVGWALASSFALLVCTLFVYKAYWQVPPGVRAEVQSVDGAVYRVSENGDRQVAPGDKLREGDRLRTAGGAHAMLRLADGSNVELNERGDLAVGARGHNMTISLDNGAVIVQAAKRTSGHLYVTTPDCQVAVTGTVFSVNSGIKGSRVAVLQGTVQVAHAGVDSWLHAGEQVATSDNLSPAPFEQQIAWSHDREKYLPLLAAFAAVEHKIGQIPFPQPRYTSDLLDRIPANTLFYASIPNLGDFLSEANTIFHDQMKQSPELQQWWDRGPGRNSEELDSLVDKIRTISQYLGDEVVIVGVRQNDQPGFAVLADVQRSGLSELLNQQFYSTPGGKLTVFDELSLASAADAGGKQNGGYALVRPHEVAFSNSISTLKQLDAQLNAGASGFATGDFGKQITSAYSRGAGIILAADLHQVLANKTTSIHAQHRGAAAIQNSGLNDVSYLIAEHREVNGVPENHLNLQFSGTRQRVASWLAPPAPIGSLDFVSPNATIALAVLSKEPKDIADDLMSMASADTGKSVDWSEVDTKLQINVRDDLAASLGGDFLISLDGPVLPTPSWKAVIEVHASQRLEQTLEQLTKVIHGQAHDPRAHDITIEPTQINDQRFYAVRDLTSGVTVAQYTFTDGFMIVAPSRALLIQALQTKASGDSLAHSAAFRALLPKDANENYSAIAYQNLSPVLTPLLTQFSGESANAIRQLAADSRPTAICAWGKDSRIEVASDSRLFGFDFLTLGRLLNSRNKSVSQTVVE
jgi:hypothetical protein